MSDDDIVVDRKGPKIIRLGGRIEEKEMTERIYDDDHYEEDMTPFSEKIVSILALILMPFFSLWEKLKGGAE